MRTTLTVDDDLARALERLRARRKASFKQIVNEVLRAGLAVVAESGGAPQQPYETPAVIGKPFIRDVDDIADVIAIGEGEGSS